MKSKKATSISVLLLVVMALVLSGAALFVFNAREKGVEQQVSDIRVIEEVYVKEELINFYMKKGMTLQEAINSAGLGETAKIIDSSKNLVEIRKKISSQNNQIEIVYHFQADTENP